MLRRKQKHPKYKTYFAHQKRIMQERYPFLTPQQIKTKVLSVWNSFSPEKKNNWGNLHVKKFDSGNSSQASDGRDASPPSESPSTNQRFSSTINMASLKKVRFSTPLSDILASPPETSMECSENSQSSESSAPSLNINMGAISEEFNSIMEHELLIEEKTQDEESEASPHDEDMLSQEISSEPALFGDSIPIWKTHKQKERNEKKEQPMCVLFQQAERKHFSRRRILAGLSPSEVQRSKDVFGGESDDDIFA